MKNLLVFVFVISTLIFSVSINAQTPISIENWTPSPTATFTSDDCISINNNDATTLIITLTGESSNGWNIVYSDGNINHKLHVKKSPYELIVKPNTTTAYTLISVSNENCNGSILSGPSPNSVAVVVDVRY